VIETILDRIQAYQQDENKSFFIMEPADLPCFIQIAKIGEDFLLDIPTSNFYEDGMEKELKDLLRLKFRKKLEPQRENRRIVSYQCRFTGPEVNKMCYVARDIFLSVFKIDDSVDLSITMR
jgi:hypothetical protein